MLLKQVGTAWTFQLLACSAEEAAALAAERSEEVMAEVRSALRCSCTSIRWVCRETVKGTRRALQLADCCHSLRCSFAVPCTMDADACAPLRCVLHT